MGPNPFATKPIDTTFDIFGIASAEQMRFAREVMMNTPGSSDVPGYQGVKHWLAEEANALDRQNAEKARAEAERAEIEAAEQKVRASFAAEVRTVWINQHPTHGRNLRAALNTVLARGEYELKKKA